MKIAIIGDYDLNRISHIATTESIHKAAVSLSKKVVARWIPTHSLEKDDTLSKLQEFDGILGAPGDPDSSMGVINAIQVSREKDIPYLGTWSGFQNALVEYAKNALQLETIDSTSELFSLLITKMSCSLISERQEINIRPGSLAHQIYGKESVIEKYNCSYSFNEKYRKKFEDSDLHCAGTNNDGDVRIVEIPNCRFFVATLFQPQLNRTELFPHPLIEYFLKTASE